jgi:cyclopropane fatty-acyl-phospholipid synthase-like methyltransferase
MKDFIHKEYPKNCDPNDFWGQVKRTVNGKPISQEQIDMIVETINNNLKFKKNDVMLDIGCGNGALSTLFFDKISSFVGIDFSEYLISIAKKNFEFSPNFEFFLGDALEFILNLERTERFTKALCYGVFSYFEHKKAEVMLTNLSNKYINLEKIYLGNLPDKNRAEKFFYKDIDFSKLLDDPQSSIGIWRNEDEMVKLANNCGWNVDFIQMPSNFYASHYRFDALLTRK